MIRKDCLREKGITLIALIVTIILLLIIAGITINAIIGDNGIISKAKFSKEKYEQVNNDFINQTEQIVDFIEENEGDESYSRIDPEVVNILSLINQNEYIREMLNNKQLLKKVCESEECRSYLGIELEEFNQPTLTSLETQTEEGIIKTSATSTFNNNTQAYQAFLNGLSYSADQNYWGIYYTYDTHYLTIEYPYDIYITSIDLYSRPIDNYSGTVTAYTSNDKKIKIGNSVTTSQAVQKVTIQVDNPIVTNKVIFEAKDHSLFYGIQNVQIHGYKIKKNLKNNISLNKLLKIINETYTFDDFLDNEGIAKVLENESACRELASNIDKHQKIKVIEKAYKLNVDYSLFVEACGWEIFSQPTLTSDETQTVDGLIKTSATQYFDNNARPYHAFLNSLSETVDHNYWGVYNTQTHSLLIEYPYEILIFGIDFYTRPRDNYSGIVSAYTSSEKTKQIGKQVNASGSVKKITIPIEEAVLTNKVLFEVTNHDTYFGMQNIQIHGIKIK